MFDFSFWIVLILLFDIIYKISLKLRACELSDN